MQTLTFVLFVAPLALGVFYGWRRERLYRRRFPEPHWGQWQHRWRYMLWMLALTAALFAANAASVTSIFVLNYANLDQAHRMPPALLVAALAACLWAAAGWCMSVIVRDIADMFRVTIRNRT